MNIGIRKVDASHGWRWIAAGATIFRKDPSQWLLLVTILFIGSRVLYAIPVLGVIALLVAPNFLAGLAHGAQALEQGKPLRAAYLVSGFLKNAAQLVTIGGISLAGKFLAMMVVAAVGGDVITEISKTMTAGGVTQETAAAVRAARPVLMTAFVAGLAIALPFLVATWFAPLLVFFDDVRALQALALSLWACVRNILPFVVYGMAMTLALAILWPLGMVTRQPDLGLWLLAPILVPSIYASYKDLFLPLPASEPQQDPPGDADSSHRQ